MEKETETVLLTTRNLYRDNKKILDKISDIEQQEYGLLLEIQKSIWVLAENYELFYELVDYREPIEAICLTFVGLARDTL